MVATAEITLEKCILTIKEQLNGRDFAIASFENKTIGLLSDNVTCIQEALVDFKQNNVELILAPHLPDEIVPHVSDGQLDYFCRHFFFLPRILEDGWLQTTSASSKTYKATFFYDSSEGNEANQITQAHDEDGRPRPIPVALSEIQPTLEKQDNDYRLVDLNDTPIEASLFHNTEASVVHLNNTHRIFEICILAAYHGSGTCHWPKQTTAPLLRFLLAGIQLEVVDHKSGSIRDIFKAIDNCSQGNSNTRCIDLAWVKDTARQFTLGEVCSTIQQRISTTSITHIQSTDPNFASFIDQVYAQPPSPQFWHVREEIPNMPECKYNKPWGTVSHLFILQVFARCLLFERESNYLPHQKIAQALREVIQCDLAWFVLCLAARPRLNHIFKAYWENFEWWETAIEDTLEKLYSSTPRAYGEYINSASAYTVGSRFTDISVQRSGILEKCQSYIQKDVEQQRFHASALPRQASLWYQQFGVSAELEERVKSLYQKYPGERAILARIANALNQTDDIADIIALYQMDYKQQRLPISYYNSYIHFTATHAGLDRAKVLRDELQRSEHKYTQGALAIAFELAGHHQRKVFQVSYNERFAPLAEEGLALCQQPDTGNDNRHHFLAAYFQLTLGEYEKALAITNSLHGVNLYFTYQMIFSFWALGNESYARSLLQRQHDLDHTLPIVLLYSGLTSMLLENNEQARVRYQQLYATHSKYFTPPTLHPEKWTLHAFALRALGLQQRFKTFQEHAQLHDPTFADYQHLHAKLPTVTGTQLKAVVAQFQPYS